MEDEGLVFKMEKMFTWQFLDFDLNLIQNFSRESIHHKIKRIISFMVSLSTKILWAHFD